LEEFAVHRELARVKATKNAPKARYAHPVRACPLASTSAASIPTVEETRFVNLECAFPRLLQPVRQTQDATAVISALLEFAFLKSSLLAVLTTAVAKENHASEVLVSLLASILAEPITHVLTA
jgi:hypothetical protein